MVRTVDMPHDNVLNILGIDSKEMSDALQFPATKRELLDKLQVRLVVFHDRIEINAVFPINPIIRQKFTSPSHREGDKGDGR
jgi:hypothetical protein